MGDFGAGACDFHSDYASDFRTESNNYASDFRDFLGDFGGAPRTAKHPQDTPETAPPEQAAPPAKQQGNKGGGNLAAHRESGKPRRRGQRHTIRP